MRPKSKIGKLAVENDFVTRAEAISPTERKAMIRKDHADLSLTKQCKLLKISRSSLYYMQVGVNAKTLKLMNEIGRVFTKYPLFGSRQIAAYLSRNGFHAGRDRVRRLMGIMGLQAIYKNPNMSNKHSQHPIFLSALKAANHAPEPCLVSRHYLHPSAARVPLSGCHHGPGNA
jgi:putative transposase